MAMDNAGGAEYSLILKDDLTRNFRGAMREVTSSVQASQKAISGQLKQIGQEFSNLGKSIRNVGLAAAAVGSATTLSFGNAVRVAGDFAETLSKFEAVFKGQSGAVREWAKEYGKAVGRAESQLLGFLAQAQDTFVPLGFDRAEAAELSKTVTKLAVDLGSFNNEITEEDAMRRLLGALVGNTENLRAFGVAANEAAVKAKALKLGFDPQNLTAYQKAMSILQIAVEGTADAQGDAARTSDSLVNRTKALKAEIERFNILIGDSLKEAVGKAIEGITAMIKSINDLLERFPVLSKIAAGFSIALTGIGVAAAAVGQAIASLGPSLGSFLATSLLLRITGASSSLSLLANGIKSVGAAISSVFGRQFLKTAIVGLGSTIKGVFSLIRGGIGMIVRVAAAGATRLLPLLLNPWTALAAAVTGVMKLIENYYDRQLEMEKKKGQELERLRRENLKKIYKDMGKDVPGDLSPLDINNARVVSGSGGDSASSGPGDADLLLANEIKSFKSAIQTLRERIEQGQRLVRTNEITPEQFREFAQRELDSFRSSNPMMQRRQSLRDELQTPIEVFRASIMEAQALFANEPEMFRRARQAAIEQFKANDKATQLAQQLRTPLEQYRDSIKEARQLFANSPENFQRAAQAALEQFRSVDPLSQLRLELQTPVEQFRERMQQVREILQAAVANMQITVDAARDLFKRAAKQAKEDLKQADPDQQRAKQIREQVNPGLKIAEQMQEAFRLVREGLLDINDARKFAGELIKGQIGQRPDVDLARSVLTSNASVASQIGAFSPTFNGQEKLDRWEQAKRDLLTEIRDGIEDMKNNQDVFGR